MHVIFFKENVTVAEDTTVYSSQTGNTFVDTVQHKFGILQNVPLSNVNEHDTGDRGQVQDFKIGITPTHMFTANDSNDNSKPTDSVLITKLINETSK